MGFAIKAFFESIVFIVLAGVFYEFLNTLLADPNVPTGQVALVGLIGVMFTLGGVWAIAASFGFVESPSMYARRRFSRS